jgi:hypothetical protein
MHKKDEVAWQSEWTEMPSFYPPTRNTVLRNAISITDVKESLQQPTTLFPKYPIYIISKGRWKTNYTAKALDLLKIPYRLVIEPLEVNDYAKVTDDLRKLLVLPFNNLGQGSIPARNFVWEHSLRSGAERHWILDDNISGFGIQKGGRRVPTLRNADFFAQCEKFVDRYTNIALAGIRYRFHHNYTKAPYLLNTRIYSCMLIKNCIPYRWRGKYNEDTDLSLRVLKSGSYCTLLFTWCYCNKAGSMLVRGGNTDTIYAEGDNRRAFAESLAKQHPDVAKVVWRFNRWHHQVDYRSFRTIPLCKKKEE